MKAKWTPEDKKRVYEMTLHYIEELKAHGFKVRTLEKIKFTCAFYQHGYCQTYKYKNAFILGVSAYRLADGWEAVKETILHELCHAIASYDSGHNKEWQELAKKVGELYGIKITHRTPHSIKTYEAAYRYVIKCDNCGATWRFMRRTKFVKAVADHHATNWKCGCGHHHFSLVKGE